MTFTKGDTATSMKGVKARAKRQEDWFSFLASGGLRTYNALMDKLALDEPIGKNQIMFMDRSERSFPYIKARKTDITTDGKELPMPIMKVSNEN